MLSEIDIDRVKKDILSICKVYSGLWNSIQGVHFETNSDSEIFRIEKEEDIARVSRALKTSGYSSDDGKVWVNEKLPLRSRMKKLYIDFDGYTDRSISELYILYDRVKRGLVKDSIILRKDNNEAAVTIW